MDQEGYNEADTRPMERRRTFHEHIDANVSMKNQFSWLTAVQLIIVLLPAAGIYANMTGNDRELQAQINQLKADQARTENTQRELRGEIRQDLQSVLNELRELRNKLDAIGQQRK